MNSAELYRTAAELNDSKARILHVIKGEHAGELALLSDGEIKARCAGASAAAGGDFFERNLETLILKHKFAYSQQEHIDKVFPTIKAGMLHLATSGIILNTQFAEDMDYLSNFIKNKIFNLSIQSDKW
jgi:hypothetical protein